MLIEGSCVYSKARHMVEPWKSLVLSTLIQNEEISGCQPNWVRFGTAQHVAAQQAAPGAQLRLLIMAASIQNMSCPQLSTKCKFAYMRQHIMHIPTIMNADSSCGQQLER